MSAVLSAAPAASANRGLEPYSKLEQKICTQLVGMSGAEVINLVGGDDASASRLKSGNLSLNWLKWIRLLTGLGYKIVNKNMQCVTQYEMRSLVDGYAFINSSPDLRARFSAWRETQPLEWDEPTQ